MLCSRLWPQAHSPRRVGCHLMARPSRASPQRLRVRGRPHTQTPVTLRGPPSERQGNKANRLKGAQTEITHRAETSPGVVSALQVRTYSHAVRPGCYFFKEYSKLREDLLEIMITEIKTSEGDLETKCDISTKR